MLTCVSYRFTLRKLDFTCSQTLKVRELIGVLELGHQISFDVHGNVTLPPLLSNLARIKSANGVFLAKEHLIPP